MKRIYTIGLIAAFVFSPFLDVFAAVQDDINNKNRQIEEIQRQIEQYQREIDQNRSKAKTLQGEINALNAQINQIALEIKSLGISISKTNLQVGDTQGKIAAAEQKIAKDQLVLAQYLRVVYKNDQESLTNILLKNETISEFFNDLNSVRTNHDNLKATIDAIKKQKASLETQKVELEEYKAELDQEQRLEQLNKRNLDQFKTQKDRLLKDTKGQESKYQELVKKSQKDIEAIRAQIQFLIQGGLTAEDAVKYAQLAAIGAGIRPAFLLALLETESRLGKNVGTGNWRDDMYLCYQRLATYYSSRRQYYLNRAETEKAAFFSIINKLGLDPDTVKVSREPSYGCGGAMGPAQFIPSTWLGYEAEVIRITGHNPPNPWNFQDAFTASATKLARGGATSKDKAGEIRAAKAYISGNGSCATVTCNSYANGIQRLAAEIESNL